MLGKLDQSFALLGRNRVARRIMKGRVEIKEAWLIGLHQSFHLIQPIAGFAYFDWNDVGPRPLKTSIAGL